MKARHPAGGQRRTSRALRMLSAAFAVALAAGATSGSSTGDPGKTKGGKHTIPKAPVEFKGSARVPQHAPKNLDETKLKPKTNGPAAASVKLFAADGAAVTRTPVARRAVVTGVELNMKVLVIAADGNETDFPAIKAFLGQAGIPFDTFIATERTLTADVLSNGATRGYYQGIILVTGNLTYYNSAAREWQSAFDNDEWITLWNYESRFGVRQATSYTFPYGLPDDYGLNLVTYQDTTTAPLSASLTDAGRAIYPYLNPSNPITFRNAWVYLATKRDATVTPLVTTSNGYVIASIKAYADGRENLAVTAANHPYLMHSLLLSYGTMNWLTRGLFLGERHVNLDVQIDDLLIDDDMWDVAANSDQTGLSFRMSGADYNQAVAWQTSLRSRSSTLAGVKLEMAYNGEGSQTGVFTPDTLTPAVKANTDAFNWLNHTLTHQNLDTTDYATSFNEIQRNHQTATSLRLRNYFKDSLVQPDISGLGNPNFLKAAADFGIKYLISDASRPEWSNPTPNAGFYSQLQPSLLIIPRRANNLFYNLRTPAEWVDEYNCYYGPTGTCAGGAWRYWDRDLTYEEILDRESDNLLSYLLRWDLDPWMFHQPNLGSYDGQRSLLGDLLDRTMNKYVAAYNLPVRNLPEHDVGIWMARRMAYNSSGVQGVLRPCANITLTSPKTALIPVTGVASGKTTENYGGQNISWIQVEANAPKTVGVSC